MCGNNDDVAERQHRIRVAFAVDDRWPGFGGRHGLFFCCAPFARSPLRLRNRHRCREVPGLQATHAAGFPDRFGRRKS